jgi:hypothetical protein
MDNVMLKPGEMTDSDAQAASVTDKLNATRRMARNMAAGYHLGAPGEDGIQSTEYWSGPVVTIDPSLPQEAIGQAVRYRNEFLSALRRSFASTNFVKETARRHADAVIGHAPTTVMQAGTDEVNKRAHELVMRWWEMLGVHKLLHGATQKALVEGRAVVRLSLSPAALQPGADGSMTVRSMDADQLLKYLRPALLPPESAWLWEDANLNPAASYSYQTGDRAQDRIELAYVDDQGKTHLTVWDEARQPMSVIADLGGRIPYLQLMLTPLITPQVLENQRAYNVVTTMANRNTELAGFLERYMINLEPPTTTVRAIDGTPTKRPIMRTGPGTMAVLFSKLIARATPQGESFEPVGPPQYGRFEPTSAQPLMAALDLAKTNIFSETRQMFALMGADASASGRSREVAISDFGASVQPTRRDVEHLGGQLTETLLVMLGALSGERALMGVTVDFRCHVQPVPPSSLERQQDRADVETGLISLATGRHRQGIDSSETEDTLIQQEIANGTSPLARAAVLSTEKQAANADGISTPKT